MELNEKTLRKFFLKAFEEIMMPRLEAIEKELAKKVDKKDLKQLATKQELKKETEKTKKNIQEEAELLREEMKFEMGETNRIMKIINSRLLDLEEKIIPELRTIQEEFSIVVHELEIMKKGVGSKFVLEKINDLESVVLERSRELISFTRQFKKL